MEQELEPTGEPAIPAQSRRSQTWLLNAFRGVMPNAKRSANAEEPVFPTPPHLSILAWRKRRRIYLHGGPGRLERPGTADWRGRRSSANEASAKQHQIDFERRRRFAG